MKDAQGMTLVELLIVISIIGILVIALGFSFQGWIGAYRVESEIKEMHVDLMNARARAMSKNREHFVRFPNATSYELYEDTSPAPDGNNTLETAADTRLGGFPKTVQYAVTWAGGNIECERSGLVKPAATPLGGTICIFTDFDGNGTSDFNPDYDCIKISQTRINMGKITNQAGNCDDANCVAR